MNNDTDREVLREEIMRYAADRANVEREFSDCDGPNMSYLLDDVFDMITKIIRQRFGLSIMDAELILRDARNEADSLVEKYSL